MTRMPFRYLLALLWAAVVAEFAWPQVQPAAFTTSLSQLPPLITRNQAVARALIDNPEIAALRQQHGIAAAGVVIADTYPFNPTLETRVRHNDGPESAGITNRVAVESIVLFELELRGQRGHRRRAAQAALSRTDYEIAFQEISLAIRTIRAFDTVLYRRAKILVLEENIRLNQESVQRVSQLIDAGKLRGVDLLVAQSEVNDVLGQLYPARGTLAVAEAELRRALGAIDRVRPQGTLASDLQLPDNRQELVDVALQRRPDLAAHRLAVAEAQAHLRLEVANRFGNVTLGPAYEYDPSRINLIGAQMLVPLPVFNTHRGDILQRQSEAARADLEAREVALQVVQDVDAALARLAAARTAVSTYETILRDLNAALERIDRLFLANEPGVDVLRVLDIRRKLLRARDGFIDSLFELRQAEADLAAALGDPNLVLEPMPEGPCLPVPVPCPE
jgi:cobalt-zinc-cadmium efflux system outer membrane protein